MMVLPKEMYLPLRLEMLQRLRYTRKPEIISNQNEKK